MGNKEVTVSVGEDGRLHYAELTGPTNAEIMAEITSIHTTIAAMKTRIEQLSGCDEQTGIEWLDIKV